MTYIWRAASNAPSPLVFLILLFPLFLFPICHAEILDNRSLRFVMDMPGEAITDVTMAAPGASWGRSGAEAAVATVYLDGNYNQDVTLYHGEEGWNYRIFLGPLKAGEHRLRVDRNTQWSAAHAGLDITGIPVGTVAQSDNEFEAIVHSPIVYARADTLGHFSDVPVQMWYERFVEGENHTLSIAWCSAMKTAAHSRMP